MTFHKSGTIALLRLQTKKSAKKLLKPKNPIWSLITDLQWHFCHTFLDTPVTLFFVSVTSLLTRIHTDVHYDTPCNVMFLFLQPITDNDASKFLLFFATDQCFKNSIIEYISQRSRLVRQMALLTHIYKDRVSSKKVPFN